ncbi:DP-EP family protein [Gallaecimonas sp. GXIMD1310]|uniref:DP-EP family protein n=1 Tax=Gallaecimonas sp. GXIMD1310 TaxID=3131926 RepID=UPI0032490E35
MSNLNNWPTKHIRITISGDEQNGFTFIYADHQGDCECVIADGPCYLEYTIERNETQQQYGFAFDGIAFSNPFNNVITDATIANGGRTITLTNPYDVSKETSDNYSVDFQFGFSFKNAPGGSKAKNLLLLSADPQVINQRDPTSPAPEYNNA